MENNQLEKYKRKLEEERRSLLAEISQDEKPENLGQEKNQYEKEEEADEAEAFGNQLAIAQDLKNRLGDIDIALGKIASGEYGICENCGKPIETEILDIDPESHLCKDCKSKR